MLQKNNKLQTLVQNIGTLESGLRSDQVSLIFQFI